ncbi:hypothetical protein CMI47_20990 [Candidatus Pacearchaeota archaeon]|nr:hypothetical protein [Candidatus Pacearchaeota archaeon]|tara:strand:+ start:1049 stop:1834 length:786 start_codon:yes stop_codon:yes gene_type:complete
MVNEFISAIIIAIVQGITEWLPVSSSGHLVLSERLLNFNGGLLFDVALHFGTLMAVFVYFGRDITEIIKAVLLGKVKEGDGKLGLLLIVATIPAGIAGFIFVKLFEGSFTSLAITSFGFGITGLVLLIASLDFKGKKGLKELGYLNALYIGFIQILSLVPGISRSGTTISGGLFNGLNEKDAMKFSFLMSIPVIFGANVLVIGNKTLPPETIWATLVSFVVGLVTIHVLYKYILNSKKNLRWFAGYTLALGVGVLVWALFS